VVDIVIPPDLWDTDDEGVILTWIYADGATVEKGKLITEMMVEKVQLELTAPATGRLRILAPPDTVVKRGQVIGRIEPL
jgi:pyruvate/2-oxoglutarate dehydrogenase complex dihydrolipoamide acyltransferase (E2) component